MHGETLKFVIHFCVCLAGMQQKNWSWTIHAGSKQGKHQPERGSGFDTFKYLINTI